MASHGSTCRRKVPPATAGNDANHRRFVCDETPTSSARSVAFNSKADETDWPLATVPHWIGTFLALGSISRLAQRPGGLLLGHGRGLRGLEPLAR